MRKFFGILAAAALVTSTANATTADHNSPVYQEYFEGCPNVDHNVKEADETAQWLSDLKARDPKGFEAMKTNWHATHCPRNTSQTVSQSTPNVPSSVDVETPSDGPQRAEDDGMQSMAAYRRGSAGGRCAPWPGTTYNPSTRSCDVTHGRDALVARYDRPHTACRRGEVMFIRKALPNGGIRKIKMVCR